MDSNKVFLFEEFKEKELIGEPLPETPDAHIVPEEPGAPDADPLDDPLTTPGIVKPIGDQPDDENLTIDDLGNFDLPDNERLPIESDEEAHRQPLRMAAEGNSVLSWEEFKK